MEANAIKKERHRQEGAKVAKMGGAAYTMGHGPIQGQLSQSSTLLQSSQHGMNHASTKATTTSKLSVIASTMGFAIPAAIIT